MGVSWHTTKYRWKNTKVGMICISAFFVSFFFICAEIPQLFFVGYITTDEEEHRHSKCDE